MGDNFKIKRPVVGSPVSSLKIINAKAMINFNKTSFEDLKQFMLSVEYEGDIGYAFIDGKMFRDNFCNGAPWEIDLMPHKEELLKNSMYVYVSPKKKDAYVDSSSAMAARFEVAEEQIAEIFNITATGVVYIELKL